MSKQEAAKYTKEALITGARHFDTTPELMAGALYGVEEEELTKEQVLKKLKEFLTRPVK